MWHTVLSRSFPLKIRLLTERIDNLSQLQRSEFLMNEGEIEVESRDAEFRSTTRSSRTSLSGAQVCDFAGK
jgi:hypothetical protein